MKDTFHVGDVVELLPYDQVTRHYAIFEEDWNNLVERNPWTITEINDGRIVFAGARYWVKAPALARYVEPVAAPVEDLL